jgi:hypothetical protein
VSDLSQADVADIDDMSPGINAEGAISDNPGLAIDSGFVYDFNFETGFGTQINVEIGDWGLHALGAPLFSDRKSRVYVLSRDAELFELDLDTHTSSGVLMVGPSIDTASRPGHSSLAGPLTDCVTGFTPII